MDAVPSTTSASFSSSSPYFVPFPVCSVTVIPAPTFTGKSWLVKQLLVHQQIYFAEAPLARVLVVLCNSRAAAFELEEEEEQQLSSGGTSLSVVSLDQFDPDLLQSGDVVIFEDVQFLTEAIRQTINVLAHHVRLAAVFVLCQGILGSKIFELLTYCHQIVLFMQSTSVARLANYIVQQFYQDRQTKDYLKECISYAERKKAVLLLELNSLSSKQRGNHIAISHLTHLTDSQNPFAVVHPHPGKMSFYEKKFGQNKTTVLPTMAEGGDSVFLPLPPTSFLMVPAENIQTYKQEEEEEEEGKKSSSSHCAKWNTVVEDIQDMIEQNFPVKKWMLCKNLAREILKTPEFCITHNRTLLIKANPARMHLPLLDFITMATRQQGPNEMIDNRKYLPFVKILLQNNCPRLYFKNKSLLSPS